MKLVFVKTLVNNVYTVEVQTTEFEQADLDLFEDFGEPSINIGGTLKNSDDTDLVTLQNAYRKLKTQFPVVQRFADTQYEGKAKDVANAWIRHIEKQANAEMTALRAKLDDFSGQEEFIV